MKLQEDEDEKDILRDTGTEFFQFLNCHIICQNFRFLVLHILVFENRSIQNLNLMWFISFRDINFLFSMNMQTSKCFMRIRF